MVLKVALAIMKLHLREEMSREKKARKAREFSRDEERNRRAPSHSRDISKSTTHNFLRTTSPLQKMSSAPDKHSVKILPSARWGRGNSCGIERTSAAGYTLQR